MIIRTMLIASEGHILTDGTTYGKVIFPADDVTITSYTEITMEAYYELFPEKRPPEFSEDISEESLEDGHESTGDGTGI